MKHPTPKPLVISGDLSFRKLADVTVLKTEAVEIEHDHVTGETTFSAKGNFVSFGEIIDALVDLAKGVSA